MKFLVTIGVAGCAVTSVFGTAITQVQVHGGTQLSWSDPGVLLVNRDVFLSASASYYPAGGFPLVSLSPTVVTPEEVAVVGSSFVMASAINYTPTLRSAAGFAEVPLNTQVNSNANSRQWENFTLPGAGSLSLNLNYFFSGFVNLTATGPDTTAVGIGEFDYEVGYFNSEGRPIGLNGGGVVRQQRITGGSYFDSWDLGDVLTIDVVVPTGATGLYVYTDFFIAAMAYDADAVIPPAEPVPDAAEVAGLLAIALGMAASLGCCLGGSLVADRRAQLSRGSPWRWCA